MEDIRKTAEITLFGKTIRAKNYVCRKNGCPYKEKKPPLKLQLSICPTSFCDGHCPFCVAAKTTGNTDRIDLKKLEKVLSVLHEQNLVRGISITGGEPFTDVELLNGVVELIFDIMGVETEVCINTNGSGLRDLHRIKRLPFIDTIHISRHHYDDAKNRAYFNTDVPSGAEIKEELMAAGDPNIFVLNCLLLKDGIGTKEEVVRYLEFAGEIGIPKVGFVTPMPVNAYVQANAVSYTELLQKSDKRFLFTTSYEDFERCRCNDAVYATRKGRLVEIYGRETRFGECDYVRGFVYGADNVLRTGFSSSAQVIYDSNLSEKRND